MRTPCVPAPYLMGLFLEFGAPRSSFRVLSEYITRRGNAYCSHGAVLPKAHPHKRPIWRNVEVIDHSACVVPPPVEFADPPSPGRCWPLWSWAQYVQSRPALCQSIDWTCPLTFVVRADERPCAGGSCSQLSVGLLGGR